MAGTRYKLTVMDWIGRIGAVLLTLFALTPDEWLNNLGEWSGVVADLRPAAIVLAISLGIASLVRFTTNYRRKLAGLMTARGTKVVLPAEISEEQLRTDLTNLLARFHAKAESSKHQVRVVMVTGKNTLDHLRWLLETSDRAQGRWSIQVLLLSPSSPDIDKLASGTRGDIEFSLKVLAELEDHCRTHDLPCSITWRGYKNLPTLRGFLIGDDELFMGTMAWDLTGDPPRLINQRRYLSNEGNSTVARFHAECFRSWFDFVWTYASSQESPTS